MAKIKGIYAAGMSILNADLSLNVEKTILYAKSILIAVPVSYLFFLPFFLAKQFNMNFWMIYGSGILLLTLGFFIHKYFANFLS